MGMGRLAGVIALGLLIAPQVGYAGTGFVTPQLLLSYPDDMYVIDYRPAINAAGTRIVFERQKPLSKGTGYDNATLYYANLANPSPQQVPVAGSTRADWCWSPAQPNQDGPIVFKSPGGIYEWTLPTAQTPNPPAPVLVSNNTDFTYPTWLPGCSTLAVDTAAQLPYGPDPHNTKTSQNPGPETQKIDLNGNILGSLSGTSLWAGFPSVNPVTPTLLALAAQQFVEPGYNENMNYVYIANTMATPPSPTPLDPDAPTNMYAPQFEGRAPTWSPDGKWIAFESNRVCKNKNNYAIYIETSQGNVPASEVTACGYNAQHAKWYRQPVNGRTLLIVSVLLHNPLSCDNNLCDAARGIASLDVTAFVTPASAVAAAQARP